MIMNNSQRVIPEEFNHNGCKRKNGHKPSKKEAESYSIIKIVVKNVKQFLMKILQVLLKLR